MSGFLTTRWIRILALMAALLFAAFIGAFSILPADDGPEFFLFPFELSDKAQHFIAYLALSGPLSVALGPRRTIHALIIAVGYGLCLELAQALLTEDRQSSILDALANTGGALVGAGLVRLMRGS